MKIPIKRLRCLRCDHRWIPTQPVITRCPRCKTQYWDQQRTTRQGLPKGKHR